MTIDRPLWYFWPVFGLTMGFLFQSISALACFCAMDKPMDAARLQQYPFATMDYSFNVKGDIDGKYSQLESITVNYKTCTITGNLSTGISEPISRSVIDWNRVEGKSFEQDVRTELEIWLSQDGEKNVSVIYVGRVDK